MVPSVNLKPGFGSQSWRIYVIKKHVTAYLQLKGRIGLMPPANKTQVILSTELVLNWKLKWKQNKFTHTE